jgi:MFS family permease
MPAAKLSLDALRSRDFVLLLLTRMLSLSALQAQAVIIGWQIYEMTRDPLMLGLVGLAEAVPAISCALFAGHIVDNSRPQRVYLYCLLGLTLNTLVLFLIGGGLIELSSGMFLLLAYTAIFVSGFARSFIMPASFSLLAMIVERKHISSASAWLSSGMQVAFIVSPAVAGIVFGAYGALTAWAMPMVLMSCACAMMFMIRATRPVKAAAEREPALQSIRAGWDFIVKTPVLLGAMALDMLAVLFGGAMALLPAFATDILATGAEGLGLLRAAPAIGAVVMALLLAVRPMKVIRVTTLLWVVAGFGVSMIGFGLSTVLWLSVIFLALSGVFDSVSMVIRHTIMQLLTPDHMRGRVASVNSMFIISSNELGAFESGVLARLIGIVPAVVVGGFGTLAVAAGAALKWPQMRGMVIDPNAPPPAPVSEPATQPA